MADAASYPHKRLSPIRVARILWARQFGTITSVACQEPAGSLTFDDGPHPEFTPRLLELLSRFGAKATFFCLGRHAARYPDIVRDAASAGHCIANHTYDHTSFRMIGRRMRLEQLRRCSRVLQPYEQPFFRPPYGHQGFAGHVDAIRRGYEVIGWSLSAADWLDRSGPWMAERLRTGLRPGSIVLLHDRMFDSPKPEYFDRAPMLEALRILFEQCDGKFRFVTVPALLKLGRPERANWYYTADPEWLGALRGENGQRREYSESRSGWTDLAGEGGT